MFQDAIRSVVDSAKNVGYDLIIAPSRGGLIPAVTISHALNVPLFPFKWSTRDFADGECQLPSDLIYALRRSEKTLLVEDIVDSGVTTQGIIDDITSWAIPPVFDIAAIVTNVTQPVPVKYSGLLINKELTPDIWIDFWWEVGDNNV